MRLFDSHAHLSDEQFQDDFESVLTRAVEAGVERILLPASDLADSHKIIKLIEQQPERLVAAVGVHPHEAKSYNQESESELARLLQHAQVVAVGEIGLDYHYDFSPREQQKAVFKAQLRLAHEYGKTLVLHDREAHGDFLEVLQTAKREGLLAEQAGVVHCYGGSWEFAKQLLQLGFYLGFDGPITFKNARQSHEVIRNMPQDRLLIETDSPYLSPVPYRGKRNEPAYVLEICRKIAELWQKPLAEVAELSYQNTLRLFGLFS